MKRAGRVTVAASVRRIVVTLLFATNLPRARADGIPQWLNPIWEIIWTLFCLLPIINWGCTTCQYVTVSSNNDNNTNIGGACRLRLFDNTTTPALDVMLQAKEGPTDGTYEVQEVMLLGNVNGTTTLPPQILAVKRTGATVVIDPNGILNGTSEASCAHILLSYDWYEGEQFPARGNPILEVVEGYGCTEFGATLLWYMVVNSFPYYKDPAN